MKFFVSYNKSDLQWAEWIAWQVEATGHSTILQVWDFQPGKNFILLMHQAVQDADCTIAVLSPAYLSSNFTQSEWAAAFRPDPKSTDRRLIPVRVQECEPPGLLAAIVYVDLIGLNEEQAKEKLLYALGDGRGKSTKPPLYPGRDIAVQPKFPGPPNPDKPVAGPDMRIRLAVPVFLINLRASRIRVTVDVSTAPARFRIDLEQDGLVMFTNFPNARSLSPSFEFDFARPGIYNIDFEVAAKQRENRNLPITITCFSGEVMLHRTTHRVTVLATSRPRELAGNIWDASKRIPRIAWLLFTLVALLIGSNFTPISFGRNRLG